SIADVRIELDTAETTAETIQPPRTRERMAWAVAGFFTLTTAAALIAWAYFSVSAAHSLISRCSVDLPVEASLPTNFTVGPLPSVSPDGRYVAFLAGGDRNPNVWRVWLRPIAALTAQPVPGSEGISGSNFHPFWSADSRF